MLIHSLITTLYSKCSTYPISQVKGLRQGLKSHMILHSDWILGQSLGPGDNQGAHALAAMQMSHSEGQCPIEELGLGSEIILNIETQENGVTQDGRQ